MSLKRLLIFSLATLFCCIALVQVALTVYFKHQVQTEIVSKSQALSQKVLKETKHIVQQKLVAIKPNQTAESEVRYEFHIDTDKANKTIKLPKNAANTIVVSKEQLGNIDALKDNAREIESIFLAVQNLDNMMLHQDISAQLLTPSSNFERFTNLILWSIVISCAIALLLAIWFANKITQPINNIVSGMNELHRNNLGVQISVEGVTEMKRCASQFNEMSSELANYASQQKEFEQKKQLAQLGEVSRAIAHALRNPVHTLNLTIDQYFKSEHTERPLLAQIAQTKIEHIDKNINALLSLSAGTVKRDNVTPINAVLQDIKLELLHGPCDIEINCPEDLTITGLESEIRSILHTLIVNAIEASDKTPVSVEVEQCQGALNIVVSDKGNGIAEHIRDHLFEPHISDKPDGAGIGLYLAKQLITLYYQGELILLKSDNTGTSFRASFKQDIT